MKKCILVILITQLLVACVPTPETEPIVQHENRRNTIPFDSLQIEKHIARDPVVLGKATVCIDADVYLPAEGDFGTVETEQHPFSKETVEKILRYFAHEQPLYYAWEKSKEEAFQDLVDFQAIATDAESDQMKLEYLKEQFESAPLEVEHIPFSSAEDIDLSSGLNIFSGGSEQGYFLFSPELLSYNRDRTLTIQPEKAWDPEDVLERSAPSISRKDAEQIAIKTVSDLGIDSFTLLKDWTSECVISRLNRTVEWGYRLIFTPKIGNIPCLYADSAAMWQRALPSIAAPWRYETITVYVGQRGIMGFVWAQPAVYHDSDGKDAFLPFDEMLDLMQNQLLYIFSAGTEIEISKESTYSVTVDQIKLVRGTIQRKDDFTVGENVPLWEIRFTMLLAYTPSETHYLYFVASDGTYVEPRFTYQEIESVY